MWWVPAEYLGNELLVDFIEGERYRGIVLGGITVLFIHVMTDLRGGMKSSPQMGDGRTYDLEGVAAERAAGCEQSGLGLGFSYCLMGYTSRE